MPTLAEVHPEVFFFMFKGEPGTRKSTQALSFPTPQYWISTDQKMGATILPGKEWGVDFKEVHFDDYTNWDSIKKKLEELQVNCPYKTVIVDSVTSTGDTINSQTIKVKGSEGKGAKVGGIPVNSLEDYKAEASAFREMIALLKDIKSYHKVNIILIAHVVGQRSLEEVGSTHQSRIIITGGKTISGKIASYCDEIYHFDIKSAFDVDKEGDYGLLTVHTGEDYARTCLPLPRRINFKNQPLYEKYIKPAIDKMEDTAPVTKF
jgi:hypothetical protein